MSRYIERIEDYLDEDNPVRAIEAFVEALNILFAVGCAIATAAGAETIQTNNPINQRRTQR